MSGSDETFVPPGQQEDEPPKAPPSFGRPSPAEEPVVVFQTVDASSGVPVFTGPAEERPGTVARPSVPGPPLIPDAILPPGTPPAPPPEPEPDGTSTGPIPRLGPGTPPPGGSAARRALLTGVGVLCVLLIGSGGVLAYTTLSGNSRPEHPAVTPPPPVATRTAAPKPRPKPKHTGPVDIRDEKKDPRPLLTSEVFPHRTITLAGRTFVRTKAVINDHCDLTANPPFSGELMRQHCRRVVRATFVSTDKKLAITAGVAVMPTDTAASAVLKTQDPAHFKWFRGMPAPGAPKIDKAGGYATSTLRGRYIGYAYATYADGHKPKPGDKLLKAVGNAFRQMVIRPIERRARR